MDWLEILKIHKGLDLFFNVSIPAAISKKETFGHVLLICPDDEIRQHFVEELVAAIQPLAVAKTYSSSSIQATAEQKPYIGLRTVRWDSATPPGEICAALTNMEPRDALVLSKNEVEIPSEGAELLRTAMDIFGIDIVVGHGTNAKSIRLDLPEFTFIIGTSKVNEDILALESHFSYVIKISKEELADICEKAILMTAMEAGCSLTDEASAYIVNCSGNDCKSAINYAKRVIEYMQHYHSIGTQISEEHTKLVLGRLGIQGPPAPTQASDETITLLRDIQKKLNGLAAELTTIKATLKAIQGEDTYHNLTEIADSLERIEESM